MKHGNKLAMAACAALSLCGTALAAEGTIVKVDGNAAIDRHGAMIQATEAFAVESGDILRVSKDSKVQLHMQDDSFFSIPGPTELDIDQFQLPNSQGAGAAVYSLKEGGLRTITGKINKGGGKYEMRTAQATITVNGSAYSALQFTGTAYPPGLYVKGESGVIAVANGGGSVKLRAGQVAYVAAAGKAPVRVKVSPFQDPAFAAKFGIDTHFGVDVDPPRIEPEPPASPS
jgi:hypothetical protein